MVRRSDNEPIVLLQPAGPLHKFILETFAATGRSPSHDDIRAKFDLPTLGEAEERIAELERGGGIHRNHGDPSITHAYPFSNEPTDHRVALVGGPEVFAMCAIDALGMPFMLGCDAGIRSACADCKASVRVEIRSREIVDHAPADIVVWLADRIEGCVAATDLCPDLNFFCSRVHIDSWKRRTGASGEQLSLEQALVRGRQVFEHVMEDPAVDDAGRTT